MVKLPAVAVKLPQRVVPNLHQAVSLPAVPNLLAVRLNRVVRKPLAANHAAAVNQSLVANLPPVTLVAKPHAAVPVADYSDDADNTAYSCNTN
jgi:hypothetical protein